MENKKKNKCSEILKAIVVVVALVLFYLYILNGRYYVSNNGNTVTDKWTQTKIICTKDY